MIWPFKRTPSISFEELASLQPPAPCGEQTEHHRWRIVEGMPCPICAAIKLHAQKQEDERRMADLIAERVVARLSSLQRRAT